MHDSHRLWLLLARLPSWLPGSAFHRAALAALASGRRDAAGRLFEAAVSRYRRHLQVERLARLRAHQLMARARGTRDPRELESLRVQVEQRLSRLDRIESLEAPFDEVAAHTLLAQWTPESAFVRAA